MKLTQSEIKYLRSLQQKKQRDIEKKFLLEGWRPLFDALNSHYIIEYIAALPEVLQKSEFRELSKLAKEKNVPIKELNAIQIKQISDTVHSQGVLALVRQKNEAFDIKSIQSAKIIVACDRVSDPGNLGTILRTCDWFGVDAVLLNEGCVSVYNEKVIRSTAGSIFHLKVFEDINLENQLPVLRLKGFRIISTAMKGKSIYTFVPKEKDIIIFGSEAHGVDSEIIKDSNDVINIPSFGKAESLNVGIACGIVLAHYRAG